MSRLPGISFLRRTFNGGMLDAMADNAAPQDAVRLIDNMLPLPQGALTTREGRIRRLDADEAADTEQMLDVFRYRSSQGNFFDVSIGARTTGGDNAVFANLAGTFTLVTGGASLTKGARTVGAHVRDRLFLANGADNVKSYQYVPSTHSVRDLGVGAGPTANCAAPVTTPTRYLTDSETYSWRITALLGEDGETDMGVEDTQTNSGATWSCSISWTALTPPAGMTVSGYRIWRKATGVATWDTWYLVGTAGAAATSFVDGDDSTEDDATVYAAGGGTKVEDNHGAPPSATEGIVFWDRENLALAWKGSRLYRSGVGKPEEWKIVDDTADPTNNPALFIDVPQDDPTNEIVTVIPAGRFAYVFNRFGVRRVVSTGVAAAPYVVEDIPNSLDHGIIGRKAAVATDAGDIFYLSTVGVRRIRDRLEAQVSAVQTDGALDVLSHPGADAIGTSLDEIPQDITEARWDDVSAVVHRNLVHWAIARGRDGDPSPTRNNDVLIYSIPTGGFVYRMDAKINDWAVTQDPSDEGYKLISASSEGGMVFQEYLSGQNTDDSATGLNSAKTADVIPWSIEDYHRSMIDGNVGQLDKFIITAALAEDSVSGASLASVLCLDGDRITFSRQITYTTGSKTVWSDSGYCVTTPGTTIATWNAVTDGEFSIVVDGVSYDVEDCDFSAATDMADIAAVLQTQARTAIGAGTPIWIAWDGTLLRFTSGSTGATARCNTIGADSVPAGTAIEGASYINAASEVETLATSITGTGLKWAADDPTDSAEYKWSETADRMERPRFVTFHGQRAQLTRITVSGETRATVYGWRLDYRHLPIMAQGRI